MKRKRTGNSLITVVIACMFVTTVSAATLTMTAGNYKARTIEGKRVENLYSSDSGIEVAYTIIGKTFDAATQYANLKVGNMKKLNWDNTTDDGTSGYNSEYIALKVDIHHWETVNDNKGPNEPLVPQAVIDENIKKDNKECEEIINNEFKRTFMNFISPRQDSKKGINESVPTTSLRDYIKEHKFVNKVNGITNTNQDYDTEEVQYPVNTTPQLWIPEAGVPNPENPVKSDGSTDEVDNGLTIDSNNLKYTIKVKSYFTTQGGNTSIVGGNSRIVQATYMMSVPNYEDIFSKQESGDLHEYLAFNDNRALTIGKNMNVNNTNVLEVNGNIFVQGQEPTTTLDNRIYEKYHGGITIANSSKVDFNNDVVTRNTFNVQDNVIATVGGNLYGRNVYIGNVANGEYGVSKKSKLTANNEVVLDNDLALKAKDSSILTIKDFYGINDKNIHYNGFQGNILNGSSGDKVKNSSSIIVNDTDESSSINITNSAYIMGTAYIDTKGSNITKEYQTGESGAVKKNYKVYSIPLNDTEKFDYYGNMQLVDDTNVFNKATRFANYWDGKSPETGGILLPKDPSNIFSVGAIVYEDETGAKKVFRSNFTLDPTKYIDTLNDRKTKYATEVYKFSIPASIADYNNTVVTSFGSLMNLTRSSIGSDYNLDKQINSNEEKGIFNYSSDVTLIVQGKDVNSDKKYYDDENKEITNKQIIKVNSDNVLNAVIATTGNVIIDGNVDFYGSIIANGTLNVTGSVSINYSKDVVDRVQQQNHDLFFNVFGVDGKNILDNTQVITQTPNQNSTVTYDLKNFLESKVWKIIK